MKILDILTEKRKIGNLGEKAAARYLKKHKYKILEYNYVAAGYEIDIIAESKDRLAFVEVKTRTVSFQNNIEMRPSSSVTPEKQRKIISVAKYYIGAKRTEKHIGLDVIEVYLENTKSGKKIQRIEHLTDTFSIDTAYNRK